MPNISIFIESLRDESNDLIISSVLDGYASINEGIVSKALLGILLPIALSFAGQKAQVNNTNLEPYVAQVVNAIRGTNTSIDDIKLSLKQQGIPDNTIAKMSKLISNRLNNAKQDNIDITNVKYLKIPKNSQHRHFINIKLNKFRHQHGNLKIYGGDPNYDYYVPADKAHEFLEETGIAKQILKKKYGNDSVLTKEPANWLEKVEQMVMTPLADLLS